MSEKHYTTGELAGMFRVPAWAVRRSVDAMGVEVPRCGQYRSVPHSLLPALKGQLEKDGHLGRRKEATVA